jgi:hypothetical protein
MDSVLEKAAYRINNEMPKNTPYNTSDTEITSLPFIDGMPIRMIHTFNCIFPGREKIRREKTR